MDPRSTVGRRTVLVLGRGAVVTSLVLPGAAAAATGDGDVAATMTIDSTFTSDGSVSLTWTDDGTV